jgi:hypothetical protein
VFALHRGGAVIVHVQVRSDPADRAALAFDIEADQSCLPIWLRSLDRALERFPVQM